MSKEIISCRLHTDIQPSHYDVVWVPDLENNNFQGYAKVLIHVHKVTSVIVVNGHELTIPEKNGKPHVVLTHITSNITIGCNSVSEDVKEQRLTFQFEKEIATGEYQLEIVFNGILNDQLTGFYRSSYPKPADLIPVDQSSQSKQIETSNDSNADSTKISRMAVTQFEPTSARRAFPCWDEPSFKATFSVTVIVSPEYRAISNMPIVSCTTTAKSDGDEQSNWLKYPAGYQNHQFAVSPKMSTYLLAIIVGEFDYISAFTENQVEMRVYAPIGKSHLGQFALDVAVKCLAYYEKLFGIRNPLPKMDLIAVPDFAFGAMENWGAITYREILLLIDPETSGQDIKTRVALVVCHELAHSFFGNLTTMEWFSYLWLNESFAHWIEHAACNHIFPEWNIWDSFVCDVNGRALNLDAMSSSHPIEVPVTHPDTISEIFDAISYAKGASVVRMLSETVSFETFIKGVQIYFARHAYGNATSEDLWNALQEASDVDVKQLMHSWISQMGYPLITASEDTNSASDKGRVIVLKQQQYFADMTQASSEVKRSWIVPISVSSYVEGKLIETVQTLLNSETGTLTLTNSASKHAAIKINHKQFGFYRVQYSSTLMDSLKPNIPFLHSTDRLGVLRDTFALASAGVIDVTIALELLAASYSQESNYDVINSASGDILLLLALHHGQDYYPSMQKFIKKLFTHNYQRLGWEKKENEDSRTGLLRALVLDTLGIANDESVIVEATKRFDAYVQNEKENPIQGDLRRTIYGIVMKDGGLAKREALVKLYKNTSSQEERVRILSSLGKINGNNQDAAEISRLNIEWCFSDDVRSSDVPYLISSIASSSPGRTAIFNFYNTQWEAVMTRFGGAQNMLMGSILSGSLSSFQTNEAADEIEKFFQSHPVPSALLTIRQIIERVRIKANRFAREQSVLRQWFSTHLQ